MEEERHFNTTIMFADMAGYTSRTSHLSRKELQDLLEEFESVIKPPVKNFGGKIIKGMRDAFLITFHSPTNAVLCGIEIQKRIEDRNEKEGAKEKFDARVGISSGEVYERGGDIFGEPVNLASRVQSLAEGGQVIFSDSTYHAMNKNEFSIVSLGRKSLKGIDAKREVYLAYEKGKKPALASAKNILKNIFSFSWKKVLIVIAIIFIILILNFMNRANIKMGGEWDSEANAALEKSDYKTINNLLEIYEKASQEERSWSEKLLAARMYVAKGNNDAAIEELNNALKGATKSQIEEVKNVAMKEGIAFDRLNLPKEEMQEPVFLQK